MSPFFLQKEKWYREKKFPINTIYYTTKSLESFFLWARFL
ncbi:hypothetical protein FUSO5_09020 [Fusobacterium necrophorum BFTR-1]|nr:hypothetical protein FUSO5_09020 [Fusobacterium necrophorum BFTR-1]KDE71911.1 hypothetical protein FUSO7_09285 [Fusobacterium necrophorum BFTR-2]